MSGNSYLGLIWQSVVRIRGVLVTTLALVTSVILWLYQPNASVPLKFVVPSAILALLAIVVVLDAGFAAWKSRRSALPRVLYVAKELPGLLDVQIVCLLEASELYSYGMQVGFYYENPDGFELLVGIGRVLNIQDDRRIQVGLTEAMPGQEETLLEFAANAKATIERISIKPSVPHNALSDARPKGK